MLLLLRHLESNKNMQKQFSSSKDLEELTPKGLELGRNIASNIEEFIHTNNLRIEKVYCANSKRAVETAGIIAARMDVGICALDELRSNNSGELRGKSEVEAKRINPTFMKQLSLFRAGIFSSYDFVKVFDREDKHEFEIRVTRCLEKITAEDPNSLKIVVLHHSSLTAAVIYFARKFYNYPNTFYGHVACELGHIYLINETDIVLCNEPACALSEVFLYED